MESVSVLQSLQLLFQLFCCLCSMDTTHMDVFKCVIGFSLLRSARIVAHVTKLQNGLLKTKIRTPHLVSMYALIGHV